MRNLTYVLLLTCFFCLIGCCRCGQDSRNMTGVKIDDLMVQILKFSIGEKTLTLDYKATNFFLYDTWICEDISVYDRRHDAEARIAAGMLLIRFRLDPETDIITEEVLAKYRRLSPNESFSGTLILKLPIREFWALYSFHDSDKKNI
jgi:hypothetical protein